MEDNLFRAGADPFRIAYEGAAVGICLITKDQNLFCANPGFCKMMKYSEEELIGKPLCFLIHPEDTDVVRKLFARVMQAKTEQSIEIRCLPKGGEITEAELRLFPSGAMESSGGCCVATLLDITDRKRAEKTMLENISHLAKVQAAGHVGNWELDVNSGMIYASEEAFRMMGIDSRTMWIPVDAATDGICEEDRRRLKRELARLTEQGGMFNVECCIRAAHRKIVRIHALAERDRDGRLSRVMGVLQDVSALRFVEADLEDTEKRFQQIYEQAPIGISVVEAGTGRIRHANRKFCQIVCRPEEEVWGLDWLDITHPEDCPAVLALMADRSGAKDGGSRQLNTRYLKPDGSCIWARNTVTDIQSGGAGTGLRLCMVEDSSERVRAEMALRKSEAQHKAMVANISEVLSILDRDGRFTYISPNISGLFGWNPEELLGQTIWEVVHKKDLSRMRRRLQRLLAETGAQSMEQFDYVCGDGSVRAVEITGTNLMEDENIGGVLLNYRDITERKKWEQMIFRLSYHDSLTGLYNRAYFDAEKARLDTGRHLPLSVIIGDVNGLKLINDAFGHAEGDKLLAAMGKILRKCTRRGDIVTRNGGDEFSMLLPHTGREEAMKILRRIEKMCADNANMADKETYFLSISLGCATKEQEGQCLDSVLNAAEEMMYKRKLQEHDELHDSILNSVRNTMYERSCETEAHSRRLAELTRTLGMAMGLDTTQLDALKLLSELHDVGQISVDGNVLCKPDKLTEEEWSQLKKHSEVGCRIAMAAPGLKHIAKYILCHHERWDGTGYPRGLAGQNIPLLSRILAVVDAYDAMTQDKPYRKAMGKAAALDELRANAGTQFDPDIVKRFLAVMEKSGEAG